MTTYLAFVRAINVAGHQPVAMADLREMLSQLGFTDPQSLLQSGNLVFGGAPRSAAHVERVLEAKASEFLSLQTDFFVCTAPEWKSVIARNPFRKEAARDPGYLVVMVLKSAPGAQNVKELRAAITGPEVLRVNGRYAYIVYPNGQGRSRLTNALIEKTLGTRGTARNWNTVLKLGALAIARR